MTTPPSADLAYGAWLATMRQELLAPANVVVQMAAMVAEDLRRDHAPDALIADIEKIGKAAQNFLNLADDVLTAARHSADPNVGSLHSRIRHELLTPLGHVVGYCDLVLEDAEEPWLGRLRDDLVEIRSAGQRLRDLVDDILNFNRAEASPGLPSPEGTVSELIRNVVGAIRPVTRSRSPDATCGRVLAVDDNAFNRHLLERWLTRQGHAVTLAGDGADALQKLAEVDFDLILLDIVMPVMNGLEALAKIKHDERLRHIPIIMISALNELDGVARCIELGAEDYLTKPFRSTILEARIGACLEKKRLRDREVDYLRQIELERRRVDELLHVILPDPIVAELKANGAVRPQRHDKVAVMFADIQGFTRFCERQPPEAVVAYLQTLVKSFEEIALTHRVLKIKTIGDSFMAAAGLLEPVPNPVESCVRAGLKMVQVSKLLPPHWNLRVGVHVGSVVAGVLGNRQYMYDLWGATVNTAARVEANGEGGFVTLSAAAWEQVSQLGKAVSRGTVNLHGIGPTELFRFGGFHDSGGDGVSR